MRWLTLTAVLALAGCGSSGGMPAGDLTPYVPGTFPLPEAGDYLIVPGTCESAPTPPPGTAESATWPC